MLNIYKLFVAVTSDLNLMTRFTYAFCYKQINFVIFLFQRDGYSIYNAKKNISLLEKG